MSDNQCDAAPTITKIGDFLLIECAACGDSWTTPVIEAGAR